MKIYFIDAPPSDDQSTDGFVRRVSQFIEKPFDALGVGPDPNVLIFDVPGKGLAVGVKPKTLGELQKMLKREGVSHFAAAIEVTPEMHAQCSVIPDDPNERWIEIAIMLGDRVVGRARRDVLKHEHGKAYLGELEFEPNMKSETLRT